MDAGGWDNPPGDRRVVAVLVCSRGDLEPTERCSVRGWLCVKERGRQVDREGEREGGRERETERQREREREKER